MNTVTIKSMAGMNENHLIDISQIKVNKIEFEWSKYEEINSFLFKKGINFDGSKKKRGSFGVVYSLQNNQVLKITSFRRYLEMFEDPVEEDYITENKCKKYLKKFLNEGKVHKLINGTRGFPNTLDVFAIEIVKSGIIDVILFIKMERYEKIKYDLLNQKQMLYLAKDVLTVLSRAHKEELINRDIKPENIMYDKENNSYILIDWGACKVPNQESSVAAAYTQGYISPERAEKAIHGSIEALNADKNPCGDIYSLGAVLYYWANNRKLKPLEAYHGSEINILKPKYNKLEHRVSNEYINILKRTLNKDPGKRFQNAEEMMQAINGALEKLKESENSKADKKIRNTVGNSIPSKKTKKKVSKVGRMMTAFIISYSILGILYLLSHYVPSSKSILNEEILKNICLLFGGLTAIGGLIELSTEIVEDIKGKKVKYIIIVILSIIVLALVGLVVKFYVVDPVVAGIRISNEGSIETYINEFQLQVNNKDVDEHFKYMTFYDKEEGYFDSDHLNEIIESSFSIKEEKSDILLRINDRTTTPGYPAQDKTDDTFGTLTKGKEVTVEIQRDDKTVDVEAYFLDNGKVYFEWMSFLNGMGFITNNPNNNTFNIITEGLSNEKDNNTIIENEKETNHRDISGTNNKSQQGTSIKNEPNTNETKTNVNTKVKNNNTVQHSEQTNPTTSNTKNNDVIEEKVEQSTDTVQEPTCPVCGSKYHTVHPTNDAPEIDIDFQ